MDKNLFYLSAPELKLIQEIDTAELRLGGTFSLRAMRERCSLMVLKHEDLDDVLATIHDQEKHHVADIERERAAREKEGRSDWPELPHFDNHEYVDVFSENFVDIAPEEPDPLQKQYREQYKVLRDNVKEEMQELHDCIARFERDESYIGDLNDALEREEQMNAYINKQLNNEYGSARWAADYLRLGRMTDNELRAMDNHLGRIRWIRQRLDWSKSPEGIPESGIHSYYANKKVFILIDNIDASARGNEMTRQALVAQAYTTALFHAFYESRRKADPAKWLYVYEIEEAMAALGMLAYLNRFDTAFKTNFYAMGRVSLDQKLHTGNPDTQFQGLGVALYDDWKTHPSTWSFTAYRKVQHLVRIGAETERYIRMAHAKGFAQYVQTAKEELHKVLDLYDATVGEHPMFRFGGKLYTRCSMVVHAAMEMFATQNPDAAIEDMKNAFYNLGGKLCNERIFVEYDPEKARLRMKDYAIDRPIELRDGSVVACRLWGTDEMGTLALFIERVHQLHEQGFMADEIHVL